MSLLDISPAVFCCPRAGAAVTSVMDATDCGRDRMEPAPLDDGLCCHDSVPVRDSAVAFRGGLGMEGLSAIGGGGKGREKSSPETATRSV